VGGQNSSLDDSLLNIVLLVFIAGLKNYDGESMSVNSKVGVCAIDHLGVHGIVLLTREQPEWLPQSNIVHVKGGSWVGAGGIASATDVAADVAIPTMEGWVR
jgi:hypothetical protein